MAYIYLGSAGNALYDNKWVAVGRLLIGMVTISVCTLLSAAVVVDSAVVSTVKKPRFLAAYVGAAVLGFILLMLQLISLISEFFSLEFLTRHAWLEAILTPGMEKMERRTKLAARKKVQLMVDNALVFHGRGNNSSISMSGDFKMTARGTALLNFQTREEKTERAGGILWGWKRVFNSSLFDEEGIWLHSRLVSSTVTQFFICIFLIVFFAIALLEILKKYNTGGTNPAQQTQVSTSEPIVYVWE